MVKSANLASERAILSVLINNPQELVQVGTFLNENDFTNESYGAIYKIIKQASQDDLKNIDKISFLGYAEKLGLRELIGVKGIAVFDALQSLQSSLDKGKLTYYAKDVKSSSVLRFLKSKLADLSAEIENKKNVHQIINYIQDEIFEATSGLGIEQNDITRLTDNIDEYIESLLTRKPFLDIGMPRWQKDVGGIRNGSITFVAARAKAGKSQMALNIASYVAKRIPVLLLDSELSHKLQKSRLVSKFSGIPFEIIDEGGWNNAPDVATKIREAYHSLLLEKNIYYTNVAGLNITSMISTIKKFVMKYVKERSKDDIDCLIIYDYVKLTDIGQLRKNIREDQVLGDMIIQLHDLASENQLNIPMIVFGQMNREGLKRKIKIGNRYEEVNEDNVSAVGDCDKLSRYSQSVSFLREKNTQECELDPKSNGNMILKVILSTYGKGHGDSNYINLNFDKSRVRLLEGVRKSEIGVTAILGQITNAQ